MQRRRVKVDEQEEKEGKKGNWKKQEVARGEKKSVG